MPFPGCFFSGVPFPGCCPLILAMTSSTQGCVFSPVFMFLHFRKAKCRISAMQLRIELISAMVSLPLQAVFQAFLAVFFFNFSTSQSFKKWLCFMQASSGFAGHSLGEGLGKKAFTSAAAFSAIAGYTSNNSCSSFGAAMCFNLSKNS